LQKAAQKKLEKRAGGVATNCEWKLQWNAFIFYMC